MKAAAEVQHQERLDDVAWAVDHRCGFADIASLWMVSRPAAWNWCQRHASPENCRKLAENGRLHYKDLDKFRDSQAVASRMADRLALIDLTRRNGWPDARLARAIGLQPSAICEWLKRNAPDGLSNALEDFSEEDEPTPAQAAA